MKTNIATFAIATLLGIAAVPIFASDEAAASAKEIYHLKDGSTLYVFQDGKMAREDKYGRAANLKIGEMLETTDGKKITANSNEVARIYGLLRQNHTN